MDLAVALIAAGRVRGDAIWSTDADAYWPRNYFDLPPAPGEAAVTFEFAHRDAGTLAAAHPRRPDIDATQ